MTDKIVVSNELRSEVDKVKSGINLDDVFSIQNAGSDIDAGLSKFNSEVLSKAKMADVGDVDSLVKDIVLKANSLDPESINKNPGIFSRMFGKAKSGIEQFKLKQESVEKYFDKIKNRLDDDAIKTKESAIQLEKLFDLNKEQVEKLKAAIVACEEKYEEGINTVLPQKEKEAEDGDPFKVQVVSQLKDNLHRLEKKIHTLRSSRMSCIQTAVLVRGMQSNAVGLIEGYQEIISGALEEWKKGYAIVLVQTHQEKTSEFQKAVKDASNEIRRRNAALLEKNSVEIAKNNERSSIDCETLEIVNQTLIRTMDTVDQIKREAKAKRAEDLKKISAMEEDLKNRVIEFNKN